MADFSEEFDVNYDSYQRFLANEEWSRDNQGLWVALVDGIPVDRSASKAVLLERICEAFPHRVGLISQVGTEGEANYFPALFISGS